MLAIFALSSCASKNAAKYKEEAQPKFSSSRALVEKPEQVRNAARAVLEEITAESDPAASGAVHEDEDAIRTGWVYSTSKDKYVVFDFNGSPKRKQLAARRKIAYSVSPALAGSMVTVRVEEEIQEVDLKTGEPKGWKNVAPDQNVYDQLIKRIRDKIRAL